MRQAQSATNGIRGGFSLVEMLVVLMIIATLMAIGSGVYFQVLEGQTQKSSQITVNKVQTYLNSQVILVRDKANDDKAIPQGVARIDWVKAHLIREFPTSFSEARNPPLGLTPLYNTPLQNAGDHSIAGHDYNGESSACLYLAFKRNRGSGWVDPDVLLGNGERKDRVRDGLIEIIDTRGNPLAFYRTFTAPVGAGQPTFGCVALSPGKNGNLGLSLSTWVTPPVQPSNQTDASDNIVAINQP